MPLSLPGSPPEGLLLTGHGPDAVSAFCDPTALPLHPLSLLARAIAGSGPAADRTVTIPAALFAALFLFLLLRFRGRRTATVASIALVAILLLGGSPPLALLGLGITSCSFALTRFLRRTGRIRWLELVAVWTLSLLGVRLPGVALLLVAALVVHLAVRRNEHQRGAAPLAESVIGILIALVITAPWLLPLAVIPARVPSELRGHRNRHSGHPPRHSPGSA